MVMKRTTPPPFVLAPGQATIDTPPLHRGPSEPIVPPEDVPEPGSAEFYAKFYPPGHPFHGKLGPRAAPLFTEATPLGGRPAAPAAAPAAAPGAVTRQR